jgi:hypothetical protein
VPSAHFFCFRYHPQRCCMHQGMMSSSVSSYVTIRQSLQGTSFLSVVTGRERRPQEFCSLLRSPPSPGLRSTSSRQVIRRGVPSCSIEIFSTKKVRPVPHFTAHDPFTALPKEGLCQGLKRLKKMYHVYIHLIKQFFFKSLRFLNNRHSLFRKAIAL